MGGKNFSILEVNPVARIDASDCGMYRRAVCYHKICGGVMH